MEATNPLNELAAALAKAQGEIQPVLKDSDNPFFKSKYASLAAIREAMRAAFSKNGLSVVQVPSVDGAQLKLRTLLLHSSGQSLDCGTLVADVDIANPQRAGSCVSYFRRYSLAALAQVVADDSEDDDGNAASQPAPKKAAKKTPLTSDDVAAIQHLINQAASVEDLKRVTSGAAYQALKANGPEASYEKTANLAKAKLALLNTPPAEQAGEDDEPKPF